MYCVAFLLAGAAIGVACGSAALNVLNICMNTELWCVAFLLAGAVIGVACGSAVLIVASVSGNT